MTGGSVRLVPLLALAMGAACARPPRAAAPPQPGLFGPSSQPVLLPPRQFEPDVPRTNAQWRAVGREAAALLSQYVAINTTNPPGNELQTAHWLKAVLAREGIEAQVFEPQAGKANLYARLTGDSSARPLILLNHMDVVLAAPEYWPVDPLPGVAHRRVSDAPGRDACGRTLLPRPIDHRDGPRAACGAGGRARGPARLRCGALPHQ